MGVLLQGERAVGKGPHLAFGHLFHAFRVEKGDHYRSPNVLGELSEGLRGSLLANKKMPGATAGHF